MGRTIYRRQNTSLDFDSRVARIVTTGDIVTLAQAKNYLRVDNNADDDLITNMIALAIEQAEHYMSRDIRSKERELFYPYTDSREIDLLWAPINTNVNVTVEDENANPITNFEVLGFNDPLIRLTVAPLHNITIKYTTEGLNNTQIQQAILALVWNQYPNTSKDPQKWMHLLTPYKNTSWI